MTYEEALAYIYSFPWYTNVPPAEAGRELLQRMGRPQDAVRFVHVAGTNGKGSTCAMLASVLYAAGYQTGLLTSPHLRRFPERIRVNGECIPDGVLAEVTDYVRQCAAGMEGLTVSGIITAAALEYFARKKCAVAVLETGLGGRLDATNAIDAPECAVLTAIGLDHTEQLGDTVEKIALEKAGIIKPGCAVAMYQPEEEEVISAVAAVCRKRGASLRIAEFDEIEVLDDTPAGQTFCYCDDTPLRLPLAGDHQTRNAAVVLEAVEILRERGWKKLTDAAVERGLAGTVWPARFESVWETPPVIADGGHNPQCAAVIRDNLDYYFPGQRHVILIGMLRDKDVRGFADIIAQTADVFVCAEPDSPRALPAQELAALLGSYGKPVLVCGSIAEGLETAKHAAGADGMVCAAGSLYLAGEVRACCGLE